MKTRKYTTGLVVSFFFAAATVVTLQSPDNPTKPSVISGSNNSDRPVICEGNNSGSKKKRKKCSGCGDWVTG